MKPTTFHYNIKVFGVKASKRYLKPLLTAMVQAQRLKCVGDVIDYLRGGGITYRFYYLNDFVLVDEKWFYHREDWQMYNSFTDDNPPTR